MELSTLRKRAGGLAFAFCLIIYVLTLCPTVYWDDAGELIAAAYTLGIPHPPGHPLFVIIGKLFTLIPLGSIAARVNFMSAFFGAAGCLLVYKIIIERLEERPWSPAAATGGALFFAFAPTVWEQATVAETTTLHCFFMMLLTLLAFRLSSGKIIWRDEARSLCLLAFLYGVSLTNHVAGIFFFPSFAYILILKFRRRLFAPKLFIGMSASFFVGLLVYAYLPIRSLMDPAIDWGNPENLRNFLWVITAEQYSPSLIAKPNVFAIAGNLALRGRDLLHQFTVLGCALGLVGAWKLARREKQVVVYSLLVIAALFYTGLNTAFISAYFVPALALMSVWIGVGLSEAFVWIPSLMERIKAVSLRAAAKRGLCVVLAAGFMLPLGMHYGEMDRSGHEYALRYGEELLESLPENAAFFTTDGYALFILWYLIYCENKRPDVMVVEPTWLAANMALASQVIEQYPDLALPDPETVAAYTADATEPELRRYLIIKSILDATYEDRPVYWGMIQKDIPFLRNLIPDGIVFRYSASPVVLDDEALAHNAAFWDSEIARFRGDPQMQKDKIAKEIFPVELNNQGLMFEELDRDDLSGWAIEMALEFNPEYPISRYNLGRLRARAGNHEAAAREYRLAVEGNPYMAVAYYGLGNAKRNMGLHDEAFMAYRMAARLYPDYHEAITAMGQLYVLVGQSEDAVERFQRALEIEPTYGFALRGLATAYLQMDRLNEAKEILDRALELESDSAPGLFALSKYYARIRSDETAADVLTKSIRAGGKDFLEQALNDEDLKEIAAGLSMGGAQSL